MGNSYSTDTNTGESTSYSSNSIKKLELQNTHEQSQLKEKNAHELEMEKLKYDNQKELQSQKQQHEELMAQKALGWIGWAFGNKENASKNITAFICTIMIIGVSIISIIVYCCKDDVNFVKSMWLSISPIITLSLGYLFGKK